MKQIYLDGIDDFRYIDRGQCKKIWGEGEDRSPIYLKDLIEVVEKHNIKNPVVRFVTSSDYYTGSYPDGIVIEEGEAHE